MKKTIVDVMICPECGSEDTYEYDTDEIEFLADGTGHYYCYCSCRDCMKKFKMCMEFEYSVTKSSIRK